MTKQSRGTRNGRIICGRLVFPEMGLPREKLRRTSHARLDSEALDFRAASELFAPVRKLKRTDLETLRLAAKHQGRKVPTVGGILLFGKERERFFPDAWIHAGRFRGTDKTRIADSVERGLVREIGTSPQDPKRRYFRAR